MDTIKIEPMSSEDFDSIDDEAECIQTNIIDSPEKKVKPRKSKKVPYYSRVYNRVQHYREAWEKNPIFANWLEPGPNSRKARCTVCNSEMTADISVLKYHAHCAKHISKLASISQINDIKYVAEKVHALEYKPDVVKKGIYNSSWEQDRRYASWIGPADSDRQAYCRLCKVFLSADTGALRRHLATYSHMKAAEFDDQVRVLSSIVLDKDSESIDIQAITGEDVMVVHEIVHHEGSNSLELASSQQLPSECLPQPHAKDDRGEPLERLSFLIGKCLLKGYKMLDAVCSTCGCVLLQDEKKQFYCVGCQYGLMEEINGVTSRGRSSRHVTRSGQLSRLEQSSGRPGRPPRRSLISSPPRIVTALFSDASDIKEEAVQEVIIKEEDDQEVAQIVISEDSNADVICRMMASSDVDEQGHHDRGAAADSCGVHGVDLSTEVSSLVLTLRAQLTTLTLQLEDDTDLDSCLDNLHSTIEALAKLKNL